MREDRAYRSRVGSLTSWTCFISAQVARETAKRDQARWQQHQQQRQPSFEDIDRNGDGVIDREVLPIPPFLTAPLRCCIYGCNIWPYMDPQHTQQPLVLTV